MPSRKIERQLESLSALRTAGATEATLVTLRKALNDRVNLVVAKAAATAAQLEIHALLPDLLEAFSRLLEKGAAADPQCWGKNALAKALKDLGLDECAGFVRGLQHVQMEAVWGSVVDTAGTLRGICVLALLQCTEEMDGREPALLLALKARTGDNDASVTGQTLASLLAIKREKPARFYRLIVLSLRGPYKASIAGAVA